MVDQREQGRFGSTQRMAIVLGGLCGAVGVMAAAGASHAGEPRNLAAIAAIALAHGPTLMALGLATSGRLFGVPIVMLGLGTVIFVGDLGLREWQGHALFPGAAPIGGGAMIAGWAAIVVAGLFARR